MAAKKANSKVRPAHTSGLTWACNHCPTYNALSIFRKGAVVGAAVNRFMPKEWAGHETNKKAVGGNGQKHERMSEHGQFKVNNSA